jgi:hypothetical protein
MDDTLNDTTVHALNNSIGSAEGVDELKLAESKLRTFEKISMFRELKIKQEFERLEQDLLSQRYRQVAEMNRTRRQRAFMEAESQRLAEVVGPAGIDRADRQGDGSRERTLSPAEAGAKKGNG